MKLTDPIAPARGGGQVLRAPQWGDTPGSPFSVNRTACGHGASAGPGWENIRESRA
jgi:hypothetical protein